MSLNAAMIGLIRSIRETKQLMQVPIILLTAVSRTDVKVEGLELGVDICLKIPFDITHLQSVVDQLLRRYESLKSYGRSVYSAFDLTQGRLLHKDDKAFLERMLDIIADKSPRTKVYIQSALPVDESRGESLKGKNVRIAEFNALLQKAAAARGLQYIDIWSGMAENGQLPEKYHFDGIHLKADGYKVWIDKIRPYVK